MKKKIIRTVSSLEPLTYYQITDEEIQEYLADDDWLVKNYSEIAAIEVFIPLEYCSNLCFSYAGTPEDYFSFDYLGLPNEIVSHSYTMDLEYTINGVIKEGKSVSLEFYDAYPENLARIYLAIKKEISTKTNSSLYHVNYAIVVY